MMQVMWTLGLSARTVFFSSVRVAHLHRWISQLMLELHDCLLGHSYLIFQVDNLKHVALL